MIATWVNAMNEVAEGTRLGIPVIVAANSKNELGGFKLGATPDDQDFTLWPGTLGLAATGDLDPDPRLRGEVARRMGRVGPPQGLHVHGRHGHRPALVPHQRHLRGGPDLQRRGDRRRRPGLPGRGRARPRRGRPDHQALPGRRGARERFRPALRRGHSSTSTRRRARWQKYHLPPFQAAIDAGTSSVMPYYAIPSDEKSAMPQPPLEDFEQVGFAFNKPILDLLRSMGHRGYINSDSGILSKMAWGVTELNVPERVGKAVTAGTDIIADTNDVGSIRTAYVQGLFSTERLDEAARLLTEEMFALGLFDNPYVDPERADEVVANDAYAEAAEAAHRKSVVLMKNHDGTLPLTADRLAGQKVYVELFESDLRVAKLDGLRRDLAAAHPEIEFTTDYRFADVAVAVPESVHRRLLQGHRPAGPGHPRGHERRPGQDQTDPGVRAAAGRRAERDPARGSSATSNPWPTPWWPASTPRPRLCSTSSSATQRRAAGCR